MKEAQDETLENAYFVDGMESDVTSSDSSILRHPEYVACFALPGVVMMMMMMMMAWIVEVDDGHADTVSPLVAGRGFSFAHHG